MKKILVIVDCIYTRYRVVKITKILILFSRLVGPSWAGFDPAHPGAGGGLGTVPSVGAVLVMAVTAAFWWVGGVSWWAGTI